MLKSDKDQQLQELVRRQQQLTEDRAREKMRLKEHLSKEAQRSINRQIKFLDNEIVRISKKIAEGVHSSQEKLERATRLQTFKGVGKHIANTLVISLPELGHLC